MAFDIDKETNKVEEMVLDMVKKIYPESKMLCLVNKGIELVHDDEKKEVLSEIPYLWIENDIIIRSNEFQHELDDSLKKRTINIERESKTNNQDKKIHKFDIFFKPN